MGMRCQAVTECGSDEVRRHPHLLPVSEESGDGPAFPGMPLQALAQSERGSLQLAGIVSWPALRERSTGASSDSTSWCRNQVSRTGSLSQVKSSEKGECLTNGERKTLRN